MKDQSNKPVWLLKYFKKLQFCPDTVKQDLARARIRSPTSKQLIKEIILLLLAISIDVNTMNQTQSPVNVF